MNKKEEDEIIAMHTKIEKDFFEFNGNNESFTYIAGYYM